MHDGTSPDTECSSSAESEDGAWRLSVSQLTTYRWSLVEEVLALRSAGLTSIGLWRPKLADFGEERAALLLAEHGITASSVSWIGGFTGRNDCSTEEALFDAREALQQAARVGAKTVVAMTGPRLGHITPHCKRLVIDSLKQLTERAEQLKLELALMVMHRAYEREWSFLHKLDDALAMLDKIGSPHVGLAIDAYHAQPDAQWLKRWPELVPRTKLLQLSDSRGRPGKPGDRLLPGEGILPLVDFVATAVRSGFRGVADVQVLSEDVWRTDYRTALQQCRQFADQVRARLQPAAPSSASDIPAPRWLGSGVPGRNTRTLPEAV